jgi:hypothetical protein
MQYVSYQRKVGDQFFPELLFPLGTEMIAIRRFKTSAKLTRDAVSC